MDDKTIFKRFRCTMVVSVELDAVSEDDARNTFLDWADWGYNETVYEKTMKHEIKCQEIKQGDSDD